VAQKVRVKVEPCLLTDGLAEDAAELLGRLGAARDLAREEEAVRVWPEQRQQACDVEVEETRALGGRA
jgi:hypothetical protein